MKAYAVWFLLYWKRLFRTPAFLCAALLPLLFSLLFSVQEREAEQIAVGLFAEEEGALFSGLVENFNTSGGLFQIRTYESREALLRAVAAKEAECGYLLEKGWEEKFRRGEFYRLIPVLEASGTVLGQVADETFFAALFEEYAREEAVRYCAGQAFFSDTEKELAKQEVPEAFAENMADGSVFSFSYETMQAGGQTEQTQETGLFPLRGIVAVMVLAAGLFGLIRHLSDLEKGRMKALPPMFCYYLSAVSALTPALVIGAVGVVSLFITGAAQSFSWELASMLLYCLAVSGFSAGLGLFLKNKETVCGILPVISLLCLLFCPVFFSMSVLAPALAGLGRLLLPWYYLHLMAGGSLLPLLAMTAVFFGIGVLFTQKRSGS